MEVKSFKYLFFLFVLLLAACREVTLVDNQRQSDAAKIVALLGDEGIDAAAMESDPSFRGKYRVTIPSDRYAAAMSSITRHGYPKNETQTFAELTESSALTPASREVEAIKADRAVAVEIEQVLSSFNGIEAPSVLVRHHQCKRSELSTVVVIGDVTKDFTDTQRAELLRVVTQAVPGIVSDNVSLVLTQRAIVETQKSEKESTKSVSSTSALLGAFGIVGMLGILIGALLVLLGSKNRRVREPTASVRSSKVERPKTS